MFQTFISTNPLPGLIVEEQLAQYTFYDLENAQTERFNRLTQATVFNRPAQASPVHSPGVSGKSIGTCSIMPSINHIWSELLWESPHSTLPTEVLERMETKDKLYHNTSANRIAEAEYRAAPWHKCLSNSLFMWSSKEAGQDANFSSVLQTLTHTQRVLGL